VRNVVRLDELTRKPLNDGAGHVNGYVWEVFTKDTVGTEALRLLVQEYPPGGYTEGHPIHSDFEQCYYVVAGTMTVLLGSETRRIPPGSFVFIPRGMKHEHRNDGDTPMVFLTINVPVRDGVPPPVPARS
jgi:putative monooxygenase